MAAHTTTYLQLPADLGGTRYGPFTGPVVFGSAAPRCDMVLDPAHGVFPVHATLQPVAGGGYALAPATGDCKLFMTPAGQPHVWPVTGPVQASAGDTVIVGTPGGPRFQIVQERVPATPTDGRPLMGGVLAEVVRRAEARALSRPGPLRSAYQGWTRVRSGRLTSPPVLVGAGIALLGLLGTGAFSCSGVVYILLDLIGLGH